MTITKSTRYALYAAAEMAMAGDAPTTVAAVAERYGIPEGALAKVFQQLVRAGLAAGTRGIGGGYRLSRPAKKITVLEVMHVFERRRDPSGCLLHEGSDQSCPQMSACGLHWLFNEVDELVRSTYESVTLETLVRRARSRSMPPPLISISRGPQARTRRAR
jgi:Rrf2 family iron-sulfur cluster assembly transcriptional regulator